MERGTSSVSLQWHSVGGGLKSPLSFRECREPLPPSIFPCREYAVPDIDVSLELVASSCHVLTALQEQQKAHQTEDDL